MTLRTSLRTGLAVLTSAGLIAGAAACTSDTPDVPPGYISIYSSEPQNPLITTNTTENGGGSILDNLFVGLIEYEPDGTPVNRVAESIEPHENSTAFDITIAEGWTFSNGEAVTSDSFINAWNFGANPANAQMSADFFANIKGYKELAEGKGDTLTGLKRIDDRHFRVELSAPESTWPLRLGYTAYAPLPSVAFDDIDAFGQNPIGNGPYKIAFDNAWVHNVNIQLAASETYNGPDKPQNPGLEFRFYTDQKTAYADMQAGVLDSVRDTVPGNVFASYKEDFPHSNSANPAAANETFGIPYSLDHFGPDEEGRLRRQAISMAIDRELITKRLYFGARMPAKDFGAPTLGEVPDLKGKDVLTFQPDKARELWEKADQIRPFSGSFEIAYNADGGHQWWVDAVSNTIRDTLDIQAQGKAYPNFKGFRDAVVNEKVNAAYRSGWMADYPSIANFLEGQYRTGGSSNDHGYSNPEFDNLLATAASQPTVEEAQKYYDQAQEILLRDLPQIPLWYRASSTAWNPKLSSFRTGWDGMPIYTEIRKES